MASLLDQALEKKDRKSSTITPTRDECELALAFVNKKVSGPAVISVMKSIKSLGNVGNWARQVICYGIEHGVIVTTLVDE